MTAKTVLITGGAGFIGSHLADAHLAAGDHVRVLDSLVPQVHGSSTRRPAYLHPDVELHVGDVRNAEDVRRALRGVDAVYHLAARVGVGQSMYEVANYVDVNALGTAVLMEALIAKPVQRLVVASSMSIYGEGRYLSGRGEVDDVVRRVTDLKRGHWEPRAHDGTQLIPVATPEAKHPLLSSIYALSKYEQERQCLMLGEAYGISTVALRFFNVYGTRQALSNPYTGVLAIFGSRLLNNRSPAIFEDGRQRRDFVHVRDVVQACMKALEAAEVQGKAINVGSGRVSTVLDIASAMAEVIGRPHLKPEVTGRFRMGDIRHCYADIGAARKLLGYEPRVELREGLVELGDWLRGQVADDHYDRARAELDARGLTL